MRLKHNLPKASIEAIEFIPEGSGEAGWIIYLNEGHSFDPMSCDGAMFIPLDSPDEALDLIVFKTAAAENASAAGQ